MTRRSIGTVRDVSRAWGLELKLARARNTGEAYQECLASTVSLTRRSALTAGYAQAWRQRIALHPALFEAGREDDRNTTFLHECAHILTDRQTGCRCNHGPPWRAMMVVLGEPPEVTHAYPYLSRKAHGKWLWTCTSCGHEYFFVTRPRRSIETCFCHLCGPDHGRLEWRAIERR